MSGGNWNLLPTLRAPLVGVIDPDAYAASTVTTGWIDMRNFRNVMAVIFAGTLGASATLDAKFQEATSGAGAGAQDMVPAKAITQLTQAGTDSDKQAVLIVRDDELSVGFTHVQLSMTVAVATSDAGAAVFGFDARVQPAADLASVDEIVS